MNTNLLRVWTKRAASIGCIVLTSSLLALRIHAQSSYDQLAHFDEGTIAHLGLTVEYGPDKSRSIDLWFSRPPLAASLFLHPREIKILAGYLEQAKSTPEDIRRKFPDIDRTGGSLLRMVVLRHGKEISLTVSRQPDVGDSYPAVVFHLAPADFEAFVAAVTAADEALAKK
jgi:hypothetical protein